MEINNICRCCLSQGIHKDLNSTYVYLDKKEIYAEMLNECFNIVLSTSYESNAICEMCITSLRGSLSFKQQVVDTEQLFLKRLKGLGSCDDKLFEVKVECTSPGLDDDSDDYFLADAVLKAASTIKKEEKDAKKKSQKRSKKSVKKNTEDGWRSKDIKSLVTRLTTPMDSCGLPELSIKKRVRSQRNITIDPSDYDNKLNRRLFWSSKTSIDKTKHKENLQTVLKYSNAIPFKNKTMLGIICGYCSETFPDPADLRSHTEEYHKKERLDFKTSFDMTEYLVKVDVTDLTCTLCEEKMQNLYNLKDHLVKCHNKVFYNDVKDHILQFKLKKGEVYDCALCSATYETFKMLKQHMNKHYSNYTCSKCDTAFATKRSLNAHRTTHLEGSFKCEHCDKIFPSKTKQHYHEKTKHLGTRNISNCPYCDVSFRSYYQRNQHMVKVHNSEAQYKCNVCNKSYILKSLLMYHIKKNHLMERNCQCTECGYRFFSKKSLKAHMVKHTGERNFSCEICHKSYARKYTLREHMRIHNNDRRFKCEVCAMCFVQKCSLKSHLLSNHGISMAASDINVCEQENSIVSC